MGHAGMSPRATKSTCLPSGSRYLWGSPSSPTWHHSTLRSLGKVLLRLSFHIRKMKSEGQGGRTPAPWPPWQAAPSALCS